MTSEAKAIQTINKYLKCAPEARTRQYFPITASQIYGNSRMCEHIIDFLGDIYIPTPDWMRIMRKMLAE